MVAWAGGWWFSLEGSNLWKRVALRRPVDGREEKVNENVTNPDPPRLPWPDSLDALAAAPQHHELVIENARVRVLNVCIAPGQIVPVHTHRWPSVVYTLRAGDFVRRDGHGKVLFDTRTAPRPSIASVVMWLEPLPPHSVENVGTREIRLFTVELKNETMSISAF